MPKVVINKLISLALLIASFAFGYVSLFMGTTMQWVALALIAVASGILFKNC